MSQSFGKFAVQHLIQLNCIYDFHLDERAIILWLNRFLQDMKSSLLPPEAFLIDRFNMLKQSRDAEKENHPILSIDQKFIDACKR